MTIPEVDPCQPAPARRRAWWLRLGVGAGLVGTAGLAVVLQAMLGHWPGEADRASYEGVLSSAAFWHLRAVELVVLGAAFVVGSLLLRTALRRGRQPLRQSLLAVASGVAVSLVAALLVTNTAEAAATSHLDAAQADALAVPAWVVPPPSPALSAVLWTPHLRASRPEPPETRRATQPNQCASGFGATAAARQFGKADGVVILENAILFPSSEQAAAYFAAADACESSPGFVSTQLALPPLTGIDAQTLQTVGKLNRPSALTRARLRVGPAVLEGLLSPVDMSTALTDAQAAAAAQLLAAAATD